MKFNLTKNTFLCSLLFAFIANISVAQIQTPLDNGLRFVEANYQDWGLTQTDITNLGISTIYTSEHNGITHIYFTQRHEGIEVYNAITSIHVASNGHVYNIGQRFISELSEKINTTTPSIDAQMAVVSALNHLGLDAASPLRIKQSEGNTVVFDKGTIAHSDIQVTKRFQPMPDGKVRLAWDLAIEQLDRADYWSLRVDAETGEVINQNNWMLHCQFLHEKSHQHDATCSDALPIPQRSLDVDKVLEKETEYIQTALAGSYNVFGEIIEGTNSPHESPIHGERNLLVDPHNVVASPFGWHDTNGEEGAEYTITRGNNVHAYLDLDDQSNPSGEPDGGEALVFDLSYNENNEPEDQRDIAVTNLFYMVNSIHDFSYSFGFTEAAGAFQANNYGNWTTGAGDYVLGEAQNGNGQTIGTQTFLNNANFATPPDGGNGVMQMFLWDQAGGKLLTVTAPGAVAGSYETGTATYGPEVDMTAISGEVIEVRDASSEATFACNEIVTEDVEGKIALIDRGGCFFQEKTLNAQEKGAIAVIICNFENSTINMAPPSPSLGDVTIPSVMIGSTDCALFRAALEDNLMVTLQVPESSGPALLDGDIDNGIIAHEFAHGISNRLTGGPLAAGCLPSCVQTNNEGTCIQHTEQMGEGWSDYFTLALTVKPGDTGEMRRGIGTYVQRQGTNGSGIRPLPYSTDMEINDFTYDDVIRFSGSEHSIGAVWCQMLWDLYWDLVEVYGFDIDYTNAEAGNNIAVQLVMDGMKMQPCQPGFVDGRNAILAADMENYGGANQCLIWESFARRGLGHDADQGDSLWDNDGTSSFETLPTCVKELKIAKAGTDIIEPGESIDYSITVVNHKDEAVTNVVVTDNIPEGCAYVMGSASDDGTASNGIVSWELGTMESGDQITLTYSISTPADYGSVETFHDDLEDAGAISDNWVSFSLDLEFQNNWAYASSADFANSGEGFFSVYNYTTESDQVLLLSQPYEVQGEQPVLRFYHSFETQQGTDGGFLQMSKDGETWTDIGTSIFKNPYRGPVSYQTFTIPFQQAYSGNSNGYIDSYVDLSEFMGETLFFRWRFGSDATGLQDFPGWFLDDVSFMDLVTYNGEACVASEEGDNACTVLPFRGTIVNPAPVNTSDIEDPTLGMSVFPNPTKNYLTVNLSSEFVEQAELSLLSVDGKMVQQQTISMNGGVQSHTLNVSNLASGSYFVRVTTPRGIAIEKVVVE